MPTILLVRHGENDMLQKGLAGRLPEIHLNEAGQRQAQEIANALESAPIKAILSSPMERAVETAQPLARAKGLEVQVSAGLNEVDFGKWQGVTYEDLKADPLWKQVHEDPQAVRFPEGETLVEVQQRAVAEIEKLAAEYGEKDVVACFTHGDVVRLVTAHYLNMTLKDFHRLLTFTASITTLHFDGVLPRVLNYNQVVNFRWPDEEEKKD
jgi:probable phosphoglycerate mutase